MIRLFPLVTIAFCLPAMAEDKPTPNKGIEGYWLGTLHTGAIDLRMGFEIKKKDDGTLTASVESIDQGAGKVEMDSVEFKDDALTLKLGKAKFTYVGKLQPDGDTIKGEMEQVVKLPLNLKRQEKPFVMVRPQHPKKPYPYAEEEVKFPSKAKDVTMAGTFTKPKGDGPFPAVALITGSGPQDRDETLMGHKPFLVIADFLTRKGIAVLRYDDRGVGKSTGNFAKSTSKDFAEDAAGAVAYLKGRKDVGKIGLMGHSEGGMIAPMVAAENPDVGFIILLAGPGTPGDEIIVAQSGLILKAMGMSDKELEKQQARQKKIITAARDGADDAKIKEVVKEIEKDLTDEEKKAVAKSRDLGNAQLAQLTTPWFKFFLTYDPRPTLKKIKCPVLAVNGEKDLQVPCKESLAGIEKALKEGGNLDVMVKEFVGLNHLFQPTKTGLPSEYGKIETTFSPEVLELIAEWINKRK